MKELIQQQSELIDFWEKTSPISNTHFQELSKIEFLPFIGAGMSVPFGYITWKEFLSSIIASLPKEEKSEIKHFEQLLNENNYLELADELDSFLNNAITEKVHEKFEVFKYSQPKQDYVYLLKNNGINTFLTTNYDPVIEKHFQKEQIKICVPNNSENAVTYDRSNLPYVLKLHGTIELLESIILTDKQYKKWYKNSKVIKTLKYFWEKKNMLFMGCSFEKDYLIENMQNIAKDNRDIHHYAISEIPKTKNELSKKQTELTRLKIRPIWYPNGHHEYVYTILWMLFEGKNSSFYNNANKTNENYIDELAKDVYDKNKLEELANTILRHSSSTPKLKWKDIIDQITTSNSKTILQISGEPGTGKSTLLSMMYLYIWDNIKTLYPILIDIGYYDGHVTERAIEDLRNYLKYIDKVIAANNNTTIVFIDGLNKYKRTSDVLENEIYAWINKNKKKTKIKFVFSIGNLDVKSFSPFSINIKTGNLPHAEHEIKLMRVDVTSSNLTSIVKKIMLYYGHIQKQSSPTENKLVDNFITFCKRISGNKVEFRTILFVAKLYESYKSSLFEQPIGQVFYEYYFENMGEDLLLNTANYTANFMLNKKIDTTPSTNYMVYKSQPIRDFLFAHFYVESLKRAIFSNLKIFDCIFTPCINRYVIDLIVYNDENERAIVKTIIDWFDNFTINQKNQAAYLLGRIQNSKAKKISCEFLRKKYKEIGNSFKNTDDIMLLRTIGVSLIYCGDASVEDDFYKKIIYDPKIREINRNFHIVYYTTDEYKIGEEIKLDNAINCSNDNIDNLYNFLYHSIKRETCSKTRYLNIITLLNLVVYKHYYNKEPLKKCYPDGFDSFFTNLKNDKTITNPVIKDYILNVEEHIKTENIYSTTIESIYGMKREVRSGWLKEGREINKFIEPESVADHTWGCCLLAQLFLSEDINYCDFISNDERIKYAEKYSKQHIIMLLFSHDFAEAYTGDVPSPSKSTKDKDNEKKIMNLTKVLDSFPFFHSFGTIFSLWEEYEKRNTFNAKIAYDIDKIEPLIQLYIYRNFIPQETAMEEKEKWVADVDQKLETEFGRNLLGFVQKYFLNQWK